LANSCLLLRQQQAKNTPNFGKNATHHFDDRLVRSLEGPAIFGPLRNQIRDPSHAKGLLKLEFMDFAAHITMPKQIPRPLSSRVGGARAAVSFFFLDRRKAQKKKIAEKFWVSPHWPAP